MKLHIQSLIVIGLIFAAALPAMGKDSNWSNRQSQSRAGAEKTAIVFYRNIRYRQREFRNIDQARQFQARLRQQRIHSTLQRGRHGYVVRYRELRFRKRTFYGCDAFKQAKRFEMQMRRRGYQTRIEAQQNHGGAIKFNARDLVGLSESAANRLARQNGYSIRVVYRDGQTFMGTRDYRTDRINLSIVRGRVIRATIG